MAIYQEKFGIEDKIVSHSMAYLKSTRIPDGHDLTVATNAMVHELNNRKREIAKGKFKMGSGKTAMIHDQPADQYLNRSIGKLNDCLMRYNTAVTSFQNAESLQGYISLIEKARSDFFYSFAEFSGANYVVQPIDMFLNDLKYLAANFEACKAGKLDVSPGKSPSKEEEAAPQGMAFHEDKNRIVDKSRKAMTAKGVTPLQNVEEKASSVERTVISKKALKVAAETFLGDEIIKEELSVLSNLLGSLIDSCGDGDEVVIGKINSNFWRDLYNAVCIYFSDFTRRVDSVLQEESLFRTAEAISILSAFLISNLGFPVRCKIDKTDLKCDLLDLEMGKIPLPERLKEMWNGQHVFQLEVGRAVDRHFRNIFKEVYAIASLGAPADLDERIKLIKKWGFVDIDDETKSRSKLEKGMRRYAKAALPKLRQFLEKDLNYLIAQKLFFNVADLDQLEAELKTVFEGIFRLDSGMALTQMLEQTIGEPFKPLRIDCAKQHEQLFSPENPAVFTPIKKADCLQAYQQACRPGGRQALSFSKEIDFCQAAFEEIFSTALNSFSKSHQIQTGEEMADFLCSYADESEKRIKEDKLMACNLGQFSIDDGEAFGYAREMARSALEAICKHSGLTDLQRRQLDKIFSIKFAQNRNRIRRAAEEDHFSIVEVKKTWQKFFDSAIAADFHKISRPVQVKRHERMAMVERMATLLENGFKNYTESPFYSFSTDFGPFFRHYIRSLHCDLLANEVYAPLEINDPPRAFAVTKALETVLIKHLVDKGCFTSEQAESLKWPMPAENNALLVAYLESFFEEINRFILSGKIQSVLEILGLEINTNGVLNSLSIGKAVLVEGIYLYNPINTTEAAAKLLESFKELYKKGTVVSIFSQFFTNEIRSRLLGQIFSKIDLWFREAGNKFGDEIVARGFEALSDDQKFIVTVFNRFFGDVEKEITKKETGDSAYVFELSGTKKITCTLGEYFKYARAALQADIATDDWPQITSLESLVEDLRQTRSAIENFASQLLNDLGAGDAREYCLTLLDSALDQIRSHFQERFPKPNLEQEQAGGAQEQHEEEQQEETSGELTKENLLAVSQEKIEESRITSPDANLSLLALLRGSLGENKEDCWDFFEMQADVTLFQAIGPAVDFLKEKIRTQNGKVYMAYFYFFEQILDLYQNFLSKAKAAIESGDSGFKFGEVLKFFDDLGLMILDPERRKIANKKIEGMGELHDVVFLQSEFPSLQKNALHEFMDVLGVVLSSLKSRIGTMKFEDFMNTSGSAVKKLDLHGLFADVAPWLNLDKNLLRTIDPLEEKLITEVRRNFPNQDLAINGWPEKIACAINCTLYGGQDICSVADILHLLRTVAEIGRPEEQSVLEVATSAASAVATEFLRIENRFQRSVSVACNQYCEAFVARLYSAIGTYCRDRRKCSEGQKGYLLIDHNHFQKIFRLAQEVDKELRGFFFASERAEIYESEAGMMDFFGREDLQEQLSSKLKSAINPLRVRGLSESFLKEVTTAIAFDGKLVIANSSQDLEAATGFDLRATLLRIFLGEERFSRQKMPVREKEVEYLKQFCKAEDLEPYSGDVDAMLAAYVDNGQLDKLRSYVNNYFHLDASFGYRDSGTVIAMLRQVYSRLQKEKTANPVAKPIDVAQLLNANPVLTERIKSVLKWTDEFLGAYERRTPMTSVVEGLKVCLIELGPWFTSDKVEAVLGILESLKEGKHTSVTADLMIYIIKAMPNVREHSGGLYPETQRLFDTQQKYDSQIASNKKELAALAGLKAEIVASGKVLEEKMMENAILQEELSGVSGPQETSLNLQIERCETEIIKLSLKLAICQEKIDRLAALMLDNESLESALTFSRRAVGDILSEVNRVGMRSAKSAAEDEQDGLFRSLIEKAKKIATLKK